jgi:hypothetical protein
MGFLIADDCVNRHGVKLQSGLWAYSSKTFDWSHRTASVPQIGSCRGQFLHPAKRFSSGASGSGEHTKAVKQLHERVELFSFQLRHCHPEGRGEKNDKCRDC